MILRLAFAFLFLGGLCLAEDSRITMKTDADQGVTTMTLDGKTIVVYKHGDDVDLPHFTPWNSPSGRNMLVDITEPFPHHRAFWVSESDVRLEGHDFKFANYMGIYSGVKKLEESKYTVPPFKSRSKHVEFKNVKSNKNTLEFDETIHWLYEDTKVADELRHYRFVALDKGEYFLDFDFRIVAAYGKLTIKCDQTHYAFPYVRMNDTFNVEKGKGTITNSEGGVNQKGTNNIAAHWVDYSAPTPDGGTEGLACFLYPNDEPLPIWLTRDYGTWGPLRTASRHNTTFEIPKGESLNRRVGFLIHNGDANTGKVAERYKAFCIGKL